MAEINNVIAEASQDLQTIEDFVNLPAGSVVNPRLLPSVDVGTLSGARQAIFEAGGLPATPFATKALMTASALVDGKYAMVTDDAVNNGLYVKAAGAWVKSDYNPTALANAYTDNKVKGVTNNFKTKALMTASALPNDSYAVVTDDTEANNGRYSKVAGAWVKSAYDPTAQSNSYTDAQIIASTGQLLDASKANLNIKKSVDRNLAKNPVEVYTNMGVISNSNGTNITNNSSYDCAAVAVDEGQIISIKNSSDTYTGGRTSTYHSALPPTTQNIIAVYTTSTTRNAFTNYVTSVVPQDAKYLVYNTRVTTEVTWNIQKGNFLNTDPSGIDYLKSIDGAESFYINELRGSDRTKLADGNIFDDRNSINDVYIVTNATLGSAQGFRMAVIAVEEGVTYTLRADEAYLFNGFFSGSYAKGATTSDNLAIKLDKIASDDLSKFTFTVPINQNITHLFLTIKTGGIDVASTLSINKSRYEVKRVYESISSINGVGLTDKYGRELIYRLENNSVRSRFAGKNFVYLGDSITQGTDGGYVKYISERLLCNGINRGSSGARSNRVADIVTAGSGMPRRDSSTAGTTWTPIDFSSVTGVTLMIGTNDSTSGISGSMSSIPTDNLAANIGNELAYFERFANDYYGNVALVIEYIKWKNPLCEIFLVSAYRKGADPATIEQIIPALKALGEFYSIPFINGTYNSGISYKFMDVYGEDNVPTTSHLNALGNKLFGNFLATKVLAGG